MDFVAGVSLLKNKVSVIHVKNLVICTHPGLLMQNQVSYIDKFLMVTLYAGSYWFHTDNFLFNHIYDNIYKYK